MIVVVDAPASIPVDESPLAVLDGGEAAAHCVLRSSAAPWCSSTSGPAGGAALSLGLAVRGTLGMLVEARLRGVVEAVAPILTELERNGFRASPELRTWALQAAGELAK